MCLCNHGFSKGSVIVLMVDLDLTFSYFVFFFVHDNSGTSLVCFLEVYVSALL